MKWTKRPYVEVRAYLHPEGLHALVWERVRPDINVMVRDGDLARGGHMTLEAAIGEWFNGGLTWEIAGKVHG